MLTRLGFTMTVSGCRDQDPDLYFYRHRAVVSLDAPLDASCSFCPHIPNSPRKNSWLTDAHLSWRLPISPRDYPQRCPYGRVNGPSWPQSRAGSSRDGAERHRSYGSPFGDIVHESLKMSARRSLRRIDERTEDRRR
jgi:hypothetical protein